MSTEAIVRDIRDVVSMVSVPMAPAPRTLLPTSRGKIIGRHASMCEVLSTVSRVARADCTVLITGESGTGKELIVAALHDASLRRTGPLVVVNCGAIPENLIESELFGHARGAFTGAQSNRQGRVAAAEGGTLFLDEVGELPLSVQVKLLRLLQQREYSPVGDTKVYKCDIRVLAATNRNVEEEVAQRRFREDLYYRLNVINIQLPALRERGADVELLASHFLAVASARGERGDVKGFTPEALDAIQAYSWPGNVRELENAVERAVLLTEGPYVRVCDLPPRVINAAPRVGGKPLPLPDAGLDLRAAVETFENALIREALNRTNGNKNRAAQLLGLNRTTLVEMVKRKHM